VFADWLFFALCGGALLRLRGTRADALRLPGGAAAATGFLVAAVLVTAGAVWQQPSASLTGLVLVLAGAPFGWWLQRRARAAA
jgi:hypothetical protein